MIPLLITTFKSCFGCLRHGVQNLLDREGSLLLLQLLVSITQSSFNSAPVNKTTLAKTTSLLQLTHLQNAHITTLKNHTGKTKDLEHCPSFIFSRQLG